MGFNTSVIVLNDALGQIEEEKEFGKRIARAVNQLSLHTHSVHGIDIPAGNHANAATVVETHHADRTTLLAFGGNCVSQLYATYGWKHQDEDFRIRLLKEFADSLGYNIVKKPKKKK